jgi:hypothetical protein
MSAKYDDDYPSCERTDVVLRVYPGIHDPDWVTSILDIEPTSVNRSGEQRTNSIGRILTIQKNGWFLSSEGKVASKDTRRHLDWLLDRLSGARVGVSKLLADDGVAIDVICVWWSVSGHGGPTLSPSQMSRLASLGLDLGFDIYFFGDD